MGEFGGGGEWTGDHQCHSRSGIRWREFPSWSDRRDHDYSTQCILQRGRYFHPWPFPRTIMVMAKSWYVVGPYTCLAFLWNVFVFISTHVPTFVVDGLCMQDCTCSMHVQVRIVYSVGLWFSRFYYYTRFITKNDTKRTTVMWLISVWVLLRTVYSCLVLRFTLLKWRARL